MLIVFVLYYARTSYRDHTFLHDARISDLDPHSHAVLIVFVYCERISDRDNTFRSYERISDRDPAAWLY